MFHLELFKLFKKVKNEFAQLIWRWRRRYEGGRRI